MLSHVLAEKQTAATIRSFDLTPVIADVVDSGLRISRDPVGGRKIRGVVETRRRDRHGQHVETVPVPEIRAFPDHFLCRAGTHLNGLYRMCLRAGPMFVNLVGLASKADAVDFSRSRQSSYGHRHRVMLAFHVDDDLKEKSLSLAFIQPAKLPADQRHQLGIFIDSLLDPNQL